MRIQTRNSVDDRANNVDDHSNFDDDRINNDLHNYYFRNHD